MELNEKIKTVRLLRRYSMDQLVSRMGNNPISKMALSKIERGLVHPRKQTIAAIASACNVPIDYFSENDISIGKINFRFSSGTIKSKQQQIEADIISAIETYFNSTYIDIDKIPFINPIPGRIARCYQDTEKASLELRMAWGIGIQPIFSVYEAIQMAGIHIIETYIEDDSIDGCSTYVNRTVPIIIINSRTNTTTERKRFTALHELAHLLLTVNPFNEDEHTAYIQQFQDLTYRVSIQKPDIEKLCHHFASAMLLPEKCAIYRIGKTRSHIDIKELIAIRETYGISIAATIHRLHDLRIIDDNYYHNLFAHMIELNRIEDGWGEYPIKELANRFTLLNLKAACELNNNNPNNITI